MQLLEEIIVRVTSIGLMVGIAYYAMRYAARKLFPKVEDDRYLGGKPSEKQEHLWMDDDIL